MRVTCECGEVFDREIPEHLAEPWRGRLERVPAVCRSCAERMEAEDARRLQEREQLEREERLRARCNASGIPKQLCGLTWDDVAQGNRPDVLDAARRLAAGDSSGLLLAGPVGVGKTWLAAAAAWALLERRALRWLSVPVLFAQLGLAFVDDARQDALAVLTGKQALVLDDLDKVRATEYAAEQLFGAIDNRVTAGAPLVITTNLELGALAAKFPEPFGEAIVSRLAQHCEAFALEGADRRLARTA